MPQVPNLTNFSVSPQGGSGARVSSPPVQDVGSQQLVEFGNAVQRAGTVGANIALDLQQQANQVRVDDALNRAKEQALDLTFGKENGFANLKGIDALERPDGQGLHEEYGTRLKTTLDDISAGLGNEAQRQAFKLASNGLMQSFSADVMRHENEEFKGYTLSVSEGVIATAQRDIGLNYTNPAAVNNALLRIRAQVARQGEILGKSASWIEAQTRNLESTAHVTAVAGALESNDIGFVESYLSRHGDEMNADDMLRVQGALTKQKGMTFASDVASEVFAGVAGSVPPEPIRAPVKGVISSGFGPRTPFRTTTGALSSANHTGVDFAAPEGAGVQAAASGRVIYAGKRAGFGNYVEIEHADGTHSFYGHMSEIKVKRGDVLRGGDQLGAVGSTGNSTGPHLHFGMTRGGRPIDPLKVRSIGGASGVGPGASLLEMVQAVRNDPRLEGHPEWQTEAEREVRSLYSAREEGEREANEAAAGSAYRALLANKGKLTPQIVASVPDAALPTVRAFADAVQADARGDNTARNPVLWGTLKADIAANPDKYRNPAVLLRYAPYMSQEDYRDLASDAVALSKHDAAKTDELKTLNDGLTYIGSELRAAGFDTTPDPDSDDADKFAAFRDAYIRQLQLAQRANGNKPIAQADARKIGLVLLAEQAGTNTGGLLGSGLFGRTMRGYEVPSGVIPYSAIPGPARVNIEAYLRANRIPVTPDNVRRVYANPGTDFAK